MIKVCDALMGSGKSTAAIQYMRDNPDTKFLYLAPYLQETERIVNACPELHFWTPQYFKTDRGNSKTDHAYVLLKQKKNVASTHQALMYYTPEMLEILKENDYTVIIDEAVNVLEPVNTKGNKLNHKYNMQISTSDVNLLVNGGYIKETSPGEYHLTGVDYSEVVYKPILKKMESVPLIRLDNSDKGNNYDPWKWMFPTGLFENANTIFILTYLFDGSEMQQYLKIHNLDYVYIGVEHPDKDTYRFTSDVGTYPQYVSELKDMIHICTQGKMNELGEDWYAMSENWYKQEKNRDKVERQKEKAATYFKNYAGGNTKGRKLCASYSELWDDIKGEGFKKKNSMLVFNQRARNDWRDRTALYYPINVFMNPSVSRYYESHGGHLDEEKYALSTLIQWIWRSAIRDGNEIYLYVPPRRMRTLLIDWIDEVSGVSTA